MTPIQLSQGGDRRVRRVGPEPISGLYIRTYGEGLDSEVVGRRESRTGHDRRVASYRWLVQAFLAPVGFKGAPYTKRDEDAIALVLALRRAWSEEPR